MVILLRVAMKGVAGFAVGRLSELVEHKGEMGKTQVEGEEDS